MSTTNPPARTEARFLSVEELRGWCATAAGRSEARRLLATIRRMRTDCHTKETANLETMRRRVAQAEANVAETMGRFDRQIQALETALAAVGELQA